MVKINYFCIRDYSNKKYIPPHQHPHWEFIQYLDLSGTSTIGDSICHFVPGTVSFIPPHTVHDERNRNAGRIIACGYEYDGIFPESVCTISSDPYITHLTKKMLTEHSAKKPFFKTLLECYMSDLIIHILRNDNATPKNTSSSLIQNAISYIDEYYMTEVDFNSLAQSIGYSLDYFRLLFRKETGVSPKQYILNKRLELAKNLIANQNLTFTEIGTHCGFEYYSQFSLFFKQKTKLSPSEYRALLGVER